MSSKLSIRKTKDIVLIERLDKQIFGLDYGPSCGEKYDNPAVIWWVARVDGEPAGFAGLKLFKEGGRDCGYLIRAGVVKAYRGFGMQKRLIKARTEAAGRIGLSMVVTYTERFNFPSANSLVRCGYQLYHPQGPWGLKDALYFRKILVKE